MVESRSKIAMRSISAGLCTAEEGMNCTFSLASMSGIKQNNSFSKVLEGSRRFSKVLERSERSTSLNLNVV